MELSTNLSKPSQTDSDSKSIYESKSESDKLNSESQSESYKLNQTEFNLVKVVKLHQTKLKTKPNSTGLWPSWN